MGIELNMKGLAPARNSLSETGREIMCESAEEGKRVARERARYDEGEMRDGIDTVETRDGADLVASDWKTPFHEWGTGVFAGDADPEYPELEPSSGSEAEEIPWVYRDENGNFWTTYGIRPQPMIRPGFVAGVEEFERQKKARGL